MNRSLAFLIAVFMTTAFAFVVFSNFPINAKAATEVQTTASISVKPEVAAVREAVQAVMRVEPAPPSLTDVFQIALKVTRPDGFVDVFNVLPVHGIYSWLYAPNQVGNFTFQVIFEGATFSNGVVYKPSSSSTVLVVPGTPRPSVEGGGGSWTTKASMSKARGGLGVAALNGRIYAIGGAAKSLSFPSDANQLMTTNEEYNPETDSWTIKKPMPTPRSNFAIAAVQGKIYCIGGIVGIEAYSTFPYSGSSQTGTQRSYTLMNFEHYQQISTNVNEVYDPATDTWENRAPIPRNTSRDTANVVNGRIYMLSGGINYVYDPISDSWTTTESTPNVEGSYVSTVIGDRIYSVSTSKHVSIYDPKTDTWREGAYTPVMEISGPVGATTGVSGRGKICVFGIEPYVSGHQENREATERRVNFVYDPTSDSWVAGDRMPTYRYDFGIANINDKLYSIGGFSRITEEKAPSFAVNEQYTPVDYGNVPPTDTVPSETETPTNHVATPETPTATLTVIASAASIVAVTTGCLVYFKKRKHRMKT